MDVADEQPELLALVGLLGGVSPWSAKWMSIESTPIAVALRRWLRLRLRAIRYSHGRTLIGRSSATSALYAAAITSCMTSSASSLVPTRWRQNESSRDW